MKKFKSINRAFKRGNITAHNADGSLVSPEAILKGEHVNHFETKSSSGRSMRVRPYDLA